MAAMTNKVNKGSQRELMRSIETYIHYYNHKRVQHNLGILTPIEKHTLYLAA